MRITKPDDFHLHLRDGDTLKSVLPDTIRRFGRAVVMPNLNRPVTNVRLAQEYRSRILAALPANAQFEPLMTLYLTDNTSISEIKEAFEDPVIIGCKLYPAGSTTNSESGVTNLKNIYPVLEEMTKCKLPLLIHAEVSDSTVDIFDREKVFIESHLQNICDDFPELPVVVEHITTREGALFVKEARMPIAATITPHHLLLNRNSIFNKGINPHHFCLPVLKSEADRMAITTAATSGNPRFFAGTDSAPHSVSNKERSGGSAGIYTAHVALELYTSIFEKAGALEKLEGFLSFAGADFYGIKRNSAKIKLHKNTWQVPESLPFAGESLVPLCAGEIMEWSVVD